MLYVVVEDQAHPAFDRDLCPSGGLGLVIDHKDGLVGPTTLCDALCLLVLGCSHITNGSWPVVVCV